MLTAGLTRSRIRDGVIRPLLIDTSDEQCRETAVTLIALPEDHLGRPKGELDDAIDELTVADTGYEAVQGLAKLLGDECEFEQQAAVNSREIRKRLFERANDRYPIVYQPTLGEDTQRLEVYSAVADELNISLEECYRGMYADLEDNKRLVQFDDQLARDNNDERESATTTTKPTGNSKQAYDQRDQIVNWLLTHYNLMLTQAVFYDASKIHFRVWKHFGTVFSHMKPFGLIHQIYPIGEDGNRVASTDVTVGHEAELDGPVSLFRQSQKYGIRMADFLSALPLCDRWETRAEVLDEGSAGDTKQFTFDYTDGLVSHYNTGQWFDSDVERTLVRKWERSATERDLQREDDVFDPGSEVMIPDFVTEHPDGRQTIMEIVGFWASKYSASKLAKIRQVETHNFVLMVSERLDCPDEDFEDVADRVLWSKTRTHVYDVVEPAEEYISPAGTDPD